MYESILNPSAAISHEYKVWLVDTTSEGYISGYIRQERPDGIDLVDSAGNVLKLSNDEIIERRESSVSLMPTGLSGGMTVDDLVNLVAFLETLK